LAAGKAADLALFNLNQLAYAGAWHDPLAALVFCAPTKAALVMVNGKIIVKDGQLTTLDLAKVVEQHNRISLQMVNGKT
jgi:cytosine/adenosine deaminase-related metal-dependent hydrolase